MALSLEVLERLIEASPDIVVATDRRGTVCYYNDGAQRNLGFARDEIIGRHVANLYPSLDEAKKVMAAMRNPALGEPGRIVNFQTRFVSKDNRTIDVAISATIVYDEKGREDGTIGFAKDISEILRKDQLALLGEIAVGLSHEINNPLAVIVNQLELVERFLRSTATPSDLEIQMARLDSVRREIDRIQCQIDRLREMSEREEYTIKEYLDGAQMVDLGTRAPGDARPLAGRSVLVVDDDPGVRQSVSDLLDAEGCRVTCVEDGLQAVAELERRTFDFVLSDVVMPGMDGYELYQLIKRRWPQTAVVLMTAFYYDRDHVLKRSRVAGLQGVLFKKPVRPERLRATLVALLKPLPPAPASR